MSKEGIAEKKELLREAGVSIVNSDDLSELMSQTSLEEAVAASRRIRMAKKSLGEVQNSSGHGPVAAK